MKRLFDKIRNSRRQRRHPDRVCAYLELCRSLVARAERLRRELEAAGAETWDIDAVQGLMDHALRQIDQIDRRLLQGEAIPHEEKVFSIFEPHTRWCAKGKAGRMVQLGVPVCIVEDPHQLVLHHRISWAEDNVDAAVPLLSETLALFPSVRGCSFDRGFHSPSNRVRLDALLDCNALPAKGTLSQKAREHEARAEFAAARRQHPAVESAIHNLECRGLDRVRAHGRDGFARTVALAILGRVGGVVAEPLPPQSRTCGHYRIRFLACRVRSGTLASLIHRRRGRQPPSARAWLSAAVALTRIRSTESPPGVPSAAPITRRPPFLGRVPMATVPRLRQYYEGATTPDTASLELIVFAVRHHVRPLGLCCRSRAPDAPQARHRAGVEV